MSADGLLIHTEKADAYASAFSVFYSAIRFVLPSEYQAHHHGQVTKLFSVIHRGIHGPAEFLSIFSGAASVSVLSAAGFSRRTRQVAAAKKPATVQIAGFLYSAEGGT
ncbi:MAG: hypothetical protein IJJ42_02555 [Clostridia bacterium]|nr:hypothetical protein [Clostridia bacterium]